MTATIVGTVWHGPMARLAAINAMAVVTFTVTTAGLAIADPEPTPAPPGPVVGPQCDGHTVPLDPRVSVRDAIGTLIYLRMLEAMHRHSRYRGT